MSGEVLPFDQVGLEAREVLGGDVVLVGGGGGLVELVAVEVGVPVDLGWAVSLDLLGVLGSLGLQDLRGRLGVLCLKGGLSGGLLVEVAVCRLVGLLEEGVGLHLLADGLEELHA